MQEIGRVKFVQVQQKPLKPSVNGVRYYDPNPIQRVDQLLLDNDGVIGIKGQGEYIIDAHNARHPASRFGGSNGISIGFTGHYHLMRERFGTHVTDGIAGENVIVEARGVFTPETLGRLLAFKNPETGVLIQVQVLGGMAPCREFSLFCVRKPLDAAALKETLQFLDDGRRGFLLRLLEDIPQPTIRAGDVLYRVDGDG